MRDLYFATQSKKKVVMLTTPYIENGRWKIFDKTYQEQTEADKIIFDGFFSAVKKHHNFLENEKRCNSIRSTSSLGEATKKIYAK